MFLKDPVGCVVTRQGGKQRGRTGAVVQARNDGPSDFILAVELVRSGHVLGLFRQ